MFHLKQFRFVLVGLLVSGSIGAANAEVVVVISASNPLSSLTPNQVADIFLGKTDVLPNGAPIVPVDQTDSSGEKEEFYKSYTNRSLSQIRAYWSKLVFTGKGEPPKAFSDSEELKRFLARYPNAIGYLDRDKVDTSLKVVTVKKD